MNNIIEITPGGIKYKNENENIKFIQFEECNKNWLDYKKRKTGKVTVRNQKYIGQKDICGKPMYIEFFTRPFVRFEFESIPIEDEAKEEFIKVKNKVQEFGWQLLDLS